MKNILIFSGGTGSIALQNSIAKYYGDNINVDIIISAYDNGKSTGECRKAFNSNILGPSDLRKNQLTQFKIQKDCVNSEKNKNLLHFFEYRFDAKNCEDAYEIVSLETGKISNLLNDNERKIVLKLINNFFFESVSKKEYRHELKYLNFNDFSISNILYASCAALSDYSLTEAGIIMAKLLGIKDNVHLISDTNVYLYAITENGYLITDEADIVDWSRHDDKIKTVKLLTKYGKEYVPAVDEDLNSDKCKNLIKNADIIIFSSGTQWSSLIPTYMHRNFKEYIKNSNAAKYIVMNNVPDKDMFGIDAKRLLEIVNQYVDLSDFVGIFNDFADNSMLLTDNIISSNILRECVSCQMSEKINDKKHDNRIFPTIMKHYYKNYLNKSCFIFDFDDTLWARDNNDKNISLENLKLLNNYSSHIVSGNSINKFKNAVYEYNRAYLEFPKCLNTVFCNGGNSIYTHNNDKFSFSKNLNSEYNINDMLKLIQYVINISDELVNISMFENRGNSILSIKPIINNSIRKNFVKKINECFEKSDIFNNYIAYANGKTTIDIMQKSYTKAKIVNILLNNNNINISDCLYVGDEITTGNDKSIASETNIDYIEVKDVYDTYTLLKTLSI